MSAVVDEDVLGFDLGISRRDLLERVLKHSFGELHDVRFRRAVNSLSAGGNSELERELDDLLAAGPRYDLERLRYAWRLHVLDAGVEILDVFANDDDVEVAAGEWSVHAGELADGPEISEGLEKRSKRDVSALVAVADRSLERTFENDFRPLDRFYGFVGYSRFDSLFECARAGERDFGLDVDAGCFDDFERGGDDFGADSVAGDYCDLSFVE